MIPPQLTRVNSRPEGHQTSRKQVHSIVSKRTAVVVLLIGLGVLTLSTGAGLSQSGTSSAPVTEVNNSTAAPGAEFMSAISSERILLSGEIDRETLNAELTQATSDEERAQVVAAAIQQVEERLSELESQAQDPQQTASQRNNVSQAGSESVAAEARALDHILERLQAAAVSLPATQFDAQYTNTSSIEQLEERVGMLTTGETPPGSTSEATASSPETVSTTTEEVPQTDQPPREPPSPEENTTSIPSEGAGSDGEDEDDDDDDDDDSDGDDDEDDDDDDNDGDE